MGTSLKPALALAAALATLSGGAAAQPEMGRMRQRAEALAYRYLEGWSSGNAQALADVQALYGPRVNFYGKFIDQRGLFAQKRGFARRWPIRRYAHRPGTMRVTCDAATKACLVRSIIDWRAESPVRGAVSRGSSTFELGLGFSGPRPVVLFERGNVIRGARHAGID
jgi:hypothetical protein